MFSIGAAEEDGAVFTIARKVLLLFDGCFQDVEAIRLCFMKIGVQGLCHLKVDSSFFQVGKKAYGPCALHSLFIPRIQDIDAPLLPPQR